MNQMLDSASGLSRTSPTDTAAPLGTLCTHSSGRNPPGVNLKPTGADARASVRHAKIIATVRCTHVHTHG